MPLFRLQIFKNLGAGRKEFSNVHFCQAADLTGAVAFSGSVRTAEQAMYMPYVNFIRTRVSAYPGGSDSFATVILNEFGTMPGTSNALPMENCYRIDFGVFGGLPSRNYVRGPVTEDYQDGGALTAALLSYWGTSVLPLWTALLPTAGGTYLCDESGNAFTSVDLYPFVVNRKLTRKRRAKAAGGGPPVT